MQSFRSRMLATTPAKLPSMHAVPGPWLISAYGSLQVLVMPILKKRIDKAHETIDK